MVGILWAMDIDTLWKTMVATRFGNILGRWTSGVLKVSFGNIFEMGGGNSLLLSGLRSVMATAFNFG